MTGVLLDQISSFLFSVDLGAGPISTAKMSSEVFVGVVCWAPPVGVTCTVVKGGVVAWTATVVVGTVDVGSAPMVAEGGGGACTCTVVEGSVVASNATVVVGTVDVGSAPVEAEGGTGAKGPPVAWTATFAVGAVPGGTGVTCTATLTNVGAV